MSKGGIHLDEQGVWKRRGLRLANLFATFVTIIVVAQLVMAMARKTPKGLGYGWVITAISIGLVAGIYSICWN